MKRINKAIAISFTSAVVSFVGLGLAAAPAFAASCSQQDSQPSYNSVAIQNNTQCTSPTAKAVAQNQPGVLSMTSQNATASAFNTSTQTNNQALTLDATTAPMGLGTIQDNHPSLTSSATAYANNNGNWSEKSVGSQTANATANTSSTQGNSQTTSLTNVTLYNTPPSVTSQTMSNNSYSNAANNANSGTFTSQTANQTANATAGQSNTQTLTGDSNSTIDGTMQQSAQKVNQYVSGSALNNANNGNAGVQTANSWTEGNTQQNSNQNLTVTAKSSVEGEGAIQNSMQNINNNPFSQGINWAQDGNLGGQSANAANFSGLTQGNSQTGTISATKIEPQDQNVNNVQNNTQSFFPVVIGGITSNASAYNNGQSSDISGTQTASAFVNAGVDQNGKLLVAPSSVQSNTQTFSVNQGAFMFNDLP